MQYEQNQSTPGPSIPLGLSDKLKMLEIARSLFEQECDRFWRRFGAILTVNVIFMAVLKLSGEKPSAHLLMLSGVFGIILCYFWYKIMVISRHYELRWHKDMVAIIESDENLKQYLLGRSPQTARDHRPFAKSAPDYAKRIVLLTGSVWCAILIYGLYTVLSMVLGGL